MPTEKFIFFAVAFLAGGLNSTDVKVYSPNGGCSKSLSPIPEEQTTPHLAYINQKVFFCSSQNSLQCYIYDVESSNWIPYTSMNSLHSKTTSNLLKQALIVSTFVHLEQNIIYHKQC
jgi:hypothetical protein